MVKLATVEGVPDSQVGGHGILRRKRVWLAVILAVLFAGMVATAPLASAAYCNHSDHQHWHNNHKDYYHFHGHSQDGGMHFHHWHNETHGDLFTVIC